MDIIKISKGSQEVLSFIEAQLMQYDPAEKFAVLQTAATTIQNVLQAESLKAIMAESLRRIFTSDRGDK